MALVLLGACGGQEREAAPAAGAGETAAGSGAAMDSAAPTADTIAAVTPDTTRKTAAVKEESAPIPRPGSAVARKSTPAPPAETAEAPDSAPASPARTARAPAPAPRKPAPAPAPAPAPPAPAQAPAAESASAQPPASAGAPLRDEYHQAPRDTVTQVVYNGWKQYNLNCARCHGEDVAGTTIAPHLVTSLKPAGPINTQESFIQVVCSGRPERGMPAWCPLGLEMERINQIYSYVKGRSDGKIGPGRPAVRPEG